MKQTRPDFCAKRDGVRGRATVAISLASFLLLKPQAAQTEKASYYLLKIASVKIVLNNRADGAQP